MVLSNECPFSSTCLKYQRGYKCQETTEFCLRLFKLNNLFANSCLSRDQYSRVDLRIDADGTDRDVFTRLVEISCQIVNFVDKGNNLYIYSEICGNGKTAWSIRLLQEYFNSIWWKSTLECHGLFVNVPRFFLSLKNSITNNDEYANHVKDNVLKADLVVWDDLATKGITEFENENLLSIIDQRMNERKSNIFTSNISPQNLQDMLGQRLFSRIINFSEIIHFQGKDKRNIKFN